MDELDKIYGKSTGSPVGMPEGISGEELLKRIKNQTPEELEECRKRGAL